VGPAGTSQTLFALAGQCTITPFSCRYRKERRLRVRAVMEVKAPQRGNGPVQVKQHFTIAVIEYPGARHRSPSEPERDEDMHLIRDGSGVGRVGATSPAGISQRGRDLQQAKL
jgi:hypothetical protein